MKKKIILLVVLALLLCGGILLSIYWDPFIDWLPIDQSGWDVLDNGGRCYLDEDGDPITGWQELDTNMYYFDPQSYAMQIRWLDLEYGRFYLGDDGIRRTGWQTVKGQRYYLGDGGEMHFGWQVIDGKRYYLGDDGVMRTGWLEMDDRRYYLGDDGAMRTGWLEMEAGRYYLDDNGVMHTGWLEIDDTCYCFGEDGVLWFDPALPAPYGSGLVNIDGWLYYVQENGYFLRDGKVGQLYFGTSGRYTSGDVTLDGYVAELLKGFEEANPQKDRFGLLRVAYDHCVNDYKYLRKKAYAKGATGWEIEDAKTMFETKRGNCYNFAAAFWALARGLGYEAYTIAGYATKTVQPHGWVQIEFDGANYFFDPEWHYAYINEKRDVKDMFMISMEAADWWYYNWVPISTEG